MKKLFLVFFILSGHLLNAQANSDSIKNEQYKIKNSELIQELERVNRLRRNQEEIINQATQTINNQNSLISSFGVIYAILSIIFAFLAVALPVITYQFGIKPSREALKDLQTNLDEKVSNLLEAVRQKQIDQALADLQSDNGELHGHAIAVLANTQHQGFSNSQLFKLYQLIKSMKPKNPNRYTLVSFLLNSVNEFADDFLNNTELLKKLDVLGTIYQYLPKTTYKKFIGTIKEIIGEDESQYNRFNHFISHLNAYTPETVIELFNDKSIKNFLSETTFKEIQQKRQSFLKQIDIDVNTFNNTYLGEKSKEKKTQPGN